MIHPRHQNSSSQPVTHSYSLSPNGTNIVRFLSAPQVPCCECVLLQISFHPWMLNTQSNYFSQLALIYLSWTLSIQVRCPKITKKKPIQKLNKTLHWHTKQKVGKVYQNCSNLAPAHCSMIWEMNFHWRIHGMGILTEWYVIYIEHLHQTFSKPKTPRCLGWHSPTDQNVTDRMICNTHPPVLWWEFSRNFRFIWCLTQMEVCPACQIWRLSVQICLMYMDNPFSPRIIQTLLAILMRIINCFFNHA